MRTHRTQDYHRIKDNTTHGMYYAAEIPYRYWDTESGTPGFSSIAWGTKRKVSREKQEGWWAKFSTGKALQNPHLILACGQPSDDLPLTHVFDVCKKFIRAAAKSQQPTGLSVEIASDEPRKDGYQDTCRLFVLTNVIASQPSRSRIIGVRDWIVRHEDVTRVVVIAGDPFVFCETYGAEPSMVFQFSGVTKFVRSFG